MEDENKTQISAPSAGKKPDELPQSIVLHSSTPVQEPAKGGGKSSLPLLLLLVVAVLAFVFVPLKYFLIGSSVIVLFESF